MTYSLVSSSVNADASVTTYNYTNALAKNETSSQAVDIGNLDEESSIITLSGDGQTAAQATSYTFTALDGTTSLNTSTLDTTIQLYDSNNNLIASNSPDATAAQQAAFAEWSGGADLSATDTDSSVSEQTALDVGSSSGGLAIAAGTYTVIATPDSVITGTTDSSDTGTLTLGSSETQGTQLSVNSQLTGSDQTEYYNYYFGGSTMKLNFNNLDVGSNARVIITNGNGAVVADSEGSYYQQQQYQALTSGTGLSTASGNYSVEVTYGQTGDPTQNLNYNFQLYAGNNYAVIYQNTDTAQPYDNTAAGSVTPTADAQLYGDNGYNQINGTAASAIDIGWLTENTTALDVYSELTSADNTDYYSMTLQQGDNLKFGFNAATTPDPSALRVQILNSTGTYVIADSEGTAAQQAAWQQLTTTNGLAATPDTYVVKVSYASGASKNDTPYEFGIYSGTSYDTEYKTTASPQTYANAILEGDVSASSAVSSAIASYLTAWSNGTDTGTELSTALQTEI